MTTLSYTNKKLKQLVFSLQERHQTGIEQPTHRFLYSGPEMSVCTSTFAGPVMLHFPAPDDPGAEAKCNK